MNPTRTTLQAIQQLLQDYRSAVFAHDIDAFCALYADEVRVFDLWQTWSYHGLPAWRAAAAAWFDSLGDTRVQVSHHDVLIDADMDADIDGGDAGRAAVSAFVSYAAIGADGTPLHSMHNRLSALLRRRGGVWKIVHEHTSAPADPATLKLLLRRWNHASRHA